MISHAQQLRFIVISGVLLARAAGEISTLTDLDYGDYRGRWCVDDHGYVHVIGQIYYPSPSACPCTCTDDGPVCIQPTCARIHPRCTRIRYKACCPMCESMARVCIYQGRSYRLLEEFRISRCERCRCGANREVYCSVSDCPAPHCVNPTYDSHHCCPVCRDEGVALQRRLWSANGRSAARGRNAAPRSKKSSENVQTALLGTG
ncbi:von Willebrand factor C domain-containing protein 2-like isoform X2 [Oryzias melastigma]|uniref:von Willebrand factor C domain-containing protein 2-like isoform X2 n=1 Tax=Oryzias melastigma TaxID=30732 RepID=UPI00168CE5F6|nr:von Willebrand factor C domain-containing protein 2-like isoform X2 [Oryzias melastigma]